MIIIIIFFFNSLLIIIRPAQKIVIYSSILKNKCSTCFIKKDYLDKSIVISSAVDISLITKPIIKSIRANLAYYQIKA